MGMGVELIFLEVRKRGGRWVVSSKWNKTNPLASHSTSQASWRSIDPSLPIFTEWRADVSLGVSLVL